MCRSRHTFTIVVINETGDEAQVQVQLVEQANESVIFAENVTVPGHSYARIREELPTLSTEIRHYRIEASTSSGLSGWTAVYDTCGLCSEEIHVGEDRIWFTNSVD